MQIEVGPEGNSDSLVHIVSQTHSKLVGSIKLRKPRLIPIIHFTVMKKSSDFQNFLNLDIFLSIQFFWKYLRILVHESQSVSEANASTIPK